MKALLATAAFLLYAAAWPAQAQDGEAERSRIAAQRAAADARFEAEEKACYGRFAVNDCLDAARKQRNQVVADLRRQEVMLNDGERKRRAAERVRELEARRAEQRQQEAVERRARALAERRDREERAADKAGKRAAQQAGRTARPPQPQPQQQQQQQQPQVQQQQPTGLAPQGKPRTVRAFEGPQPEDVRAARNRQQYEARRKEAEAHKAEVLERNARRTKPLAAGLPPP